VLCDRLAARLLLGLGRPLDASKHLSSARRRLLDSSADPAELAACEQQLAYALHQLGRLEDVVGLLVSARELYTKADLAREAGVCDNDLGVLMARVGDPDRALDHFEAARDCLKAGSRELAVVAFNEATVLWDSGRLDEADERLVEARTAFAAQHAEVEVAWCDQNRGVLAVAAGRVEDAVDRFVDAQDRYRVAAAWTAVAWCDANLALVLDALGRRASGRR
jgi:tetratricopeptide (TPR) repeat protein